MVLLRHKHMRFFFANYFKQKLFYQFQELSLPLQKFRYSTEVQKMSEFIYPNNTKVKLVDCEKVFKSLTDRQKLYAHYLSKACFYGGLIVLPQTSLESPLIFVLLHKLFKAQPINELKQIAIQKCSFTEDEFQALLIYAAALFSNMGNYKDYGDTKFIPNLSKDKFQELVLASKATEKDPVCMKKLILCIDKIFSLENDEKQLGFPFIGKTTYLSKNITQEDLDIVKDFFKQQKFEPVNSRLFKTSDNCYEIKLASVLKNADTEEKDLLSTHTVNGHKFIFTRGDYSELLKIVNKYLTLAKDYAANETQVKMIEHYIQSFHTGSIEHHKEGSRYWIKDKGPVIENYIGFIETYRDPSGMRAEFEGFVAIVNKDMSVKFTNLVEAATNILPLLPWPAEYEKDKFMRPDFTSLDILTFAGSGIPAGICIPNYNEIRQDEGFKNVSLGNIISCRTKRNTNFLSKEDQELFDDYFVQSFEVQVGLHELLGHGSGKLFQRKSDGSFNFDIEKVKHLETNDKISSYYEEGETYDSVFGPLGSPYEECRAECVGLLLCLNSEVMKLFGHEGSEEEKVVNCNWLYMLYAAIESLKMYQPNTESWLQAHSQAAYVILQVCLEAGEDFVCVDQIKGSDGNPDLLLTVDYSKIRTVGKKAIGDFLRKLQLYRSTADVSSAKAMFDKYSAVTSEDKYPFLNYREIVMARKKPRDMFVQVNTVIKDDKVNLITYETSPEGLIQSWLDRYPGHDVDYLLMDIWTENRPYFE